jgi:hypothetical protein
MHLVAGGERGFMRPFPARSSVSAYCGLALIALVLIAGGMRFGLRDAQSFLQATGTAVITKNVGNFSR